MISFILVSVSLVLYASPWAIDPAEPPSTYCRKEACLCYSPCYSYEHMEWTSFPSLPCLSLFTVLYSSLVVYIIIYYIASFHINIFISALAVAKFQLPTIPMLRPFLPSP